MRTSFFIRVDGRIQAIQFEDVLSISSKKNYCEIVTVKGKLITYGTISCFEVQLPKNLFCRVHRSHIISLQKINYFKFDHVVLAGEKKLPLTKAGYKVLLEQILLIGECDSVKRETPDEREGRKGY
jgi:DNA-binding LytR/AlgR family response regulator